MSKSIEELVKIDELKEEIKDLNFSEEQKSSLDERLSQVSGWSIIAFVGPYWIGKSQLLYEIWKGHPKKEWYFFESWRYANRKSLWEWFLLELSSFLKGKRDILKQDLQELEWGKIDWEYFLKLFLFFLMGFLIGHVLIFVLLVEWVTWLDYLVLILWEHFVDVFALWTLVAIIANIRSLLPRSQPITRMLQFEKKFKELVEDTRSKNICVVVEDLDRVGDDWLVFLETLKYSLNHKDNKSNDHSICNWKIICPVENSWITQWVDKKLKCIDYVEYFDKSVDSISDRIGRVFEGATEAEKDCLKWVVQRKFTSFDRNWRVLKFAIRHVLVSYEHVRSGNPDLHRFFYFVHNFKDIKYARNVTTHEYELKYGSTTNRDSYFKRKSFRSLLKTYIDNHIVQKNGEFDENTDLDVLAIKVEIKKEKEGITASGNEGWPIKIFFPKYYEHRLPLNQ